MKNTSDLELKLLASLPIPIGNLGEIRQLKLKEIIDIGESKYNDLLSILLIDKDSIEGLENEDVHNLEVLMTLSVVNEEVKIKALNALKLFFQKDFFVDENGFFYCDEQVIIDKEIFDELQFILQKVNHIQPKKIEEKIVAGNDRAAQFMEKLRKNKSKYKAPEKINLHSIISGIAWKSHSTSILNIFDLTIYQLYDAYFRLENIDNYHYTLSGMYAGTVDGKNIDLSKITWTKILKN